MDKKMNILFLGYSNLVKKRVLSVIQKHRIEYSIASKSTKEKIIGAAKQFSSYEKALKESNANIVYISLPNSLHYFWAKKALMLGYNVIIDKPISYKVSETKDLIKIAKQKKRLLSEAIFYNYHKQIKQAILLAGGIKKIDNVQVNFIIPKPKKDSLLASKKFKGGVIMDMGPYASSVNRIFFNEKIVSKKIIVQRNSSNLPVSINLLVKYKTKFFSGFFKFGGEYINEVMIFTKNKNIKISRVFSPPSNLPLYLKINKTNKEKTILVGKDNCFENYLIELNKKLKKKEYAYYFDRIEKDHLFRNYIEKNNK